MNRTNIKNMEDKTLLVVICILLSFMCFQIQAQIFGSDDRSYIIPSGSEEEKCYDQFYEWTRNFRNKNLPVTVYNFEIYMRDGLQNVLNGRIQDGIGAIGVVATEGKKEAWWLLGCMYSYGLGVTRNKYIGDIFFSKADMSKQYKASEIAQMDCSAFISGMEKAVADMSKSIDAKMMLLNEMNSTQNSFYSSNGSSSDNYSSKKNKSNYPYCCGTGYFIEQSSYSGTMIGTTPYYNGLGSKCTICGKTNKHWHLECKHP